MKGIHWMALAAFFLSDSTGLERLWSMDKVVAKH